MIKGIASSRGAITILNAIPTGIGAAMGITLQTDAEVIISDGKPGISVKLEEKMEDDTLARECIKLIFESLDKELTDVRVSTRSSIPISRGLKSSSAAANAMSLATFRALNAEIDDVDVIKLGVEAAKKANVTVTGAFDDACACYFGGIAVTDNSKMKIIERVPKPKEKLRVILHVPEQKIRKKGITKDTFGKQMTEFKKVEKLVLDGEYFEAMIQNGKLIAKGLGIKDSISNKALKAGALAAGITGTGPAIAIIVENSKFEDVLDIVTADCEAVITAHLNEVPAPEVKPCL